MTLLTAATLGCRPAKEPARPPEALLRTPRETIARLLDARRRALYHEVGALVIPSRSRATLTFLMSLDEFVAANARLCNWVRDRVGVAAADMIDQAYITDDLAVYAGDGVGIFSRHVELLDVHTADGLATVSYRVPTRLIPREALLRREPTGWRLDPGPGSTDQLAAAFKSLAAGIDSLRSELQAGYIPATELHQNPMRLVEKLQMRLRPGVSLLSRAQAASATQPSPSAIEGPHQHPSASAGTGQ